MEITHIYPAEDNLYQNVEGKAPYDLVLQSNCFGEGLLDFLEGDSSEYEKRLAMRRARFIMSPIIDKEISGISSIRGGSPIVKLFTEGTKNSDFAHKTNDRTPIEILNSFATLPDDILIDLLQIHRDNFKPESTEFYNTHLPLYAKTYEAALVEDHESICLLPPLALQRFRENYDPKKIIYQDKLIETFRAHRFDVPETAGHVDPITKITYIGSGPDWTHLHHVTWHEFTHLTAGTLKSNDPSFDPENYFPESGLFRGLKHHWLNEAVTEHITQSLGTTGSRPVLQKELKMFEHLANNGKQKIPYKLFYDAYYEDHFINGPEHFHPKWDELHEAINTSHGPNFLHRFEKKNNTM